VHSLSPPKPAGLDPQKFRRHTTNWLRNVDSQKNLKKNWCFFGPLKAGGGGTLSKKNFDIYIFKPAMAAWVAVLKL
jgi:hypothetical protein